MNNYTMDIDPLKLGYAVPKIEDVKKELLCNMNELLARGLKTSFQWYAFQYRFYRLLS